MKRAGGGGGVDGGGGGVADRARVAPSYYCSVFIPEFSLLMFEIF